MYYLGMGSQGQKNECGIHDYGALTHGSLLTTQTVHSCQKSRTCAMDTEWICGPRDNRCQQDLGQVSINCLVLGASLSQHGGHDHATVPVHGVSNTLCPI